MLRYFQPRKPAFISLIALITLAVALGGWGFIQNSHPDDAQIEQWGVLAGVRDEEAIRALQKAAEGGSIVASRLLGQVLALRSEEASVKDGQRLLQRAAESGDARANLLLGKLLLSGGPGVSAAPLEARGWLEAAVKGGQLGAAHYLGLIYRQDLPDQPRSSEKALHWLEVAAKAGFADSQFLLGQMIMTGDGVAPDAERARTWFEAAAEQDHPEANLQLLMASTRNELGMKHSADSEKRQWMEAEHSLRHRPAAP
jgi:TPR repeat protein